MSSLNVQKLTIWRRDFWTRKLFFFRYATELYNHTGDTGDAFATDAFENVNEAADPLLGALVAMLGEQLQREFAPYILADALAK